MRILQLFGFIVFGLLISVLETKSFPAPDHEDSDDYDELNDLFRIRKVYQLCATYKLLIKLVHKLKELFSGDADLRL